MSIQVLLSQKNNLITQGICSCIENEHDIVLLGVSEDVQSMLRSCGEFAPDVLVLSLDLQCTSITSLIRQILNQHPEMKIVALSRSADRHSILEVLSAGALGYVTSTHSTINELVCAIRSAADNRVYLCQEVSSIVGSGLRRSRSDGITSSCQLGDREEQVLIMIADGFSSKQIALQLHISPSTVEVHRRNIMRKIGLHKVADLTRYAIRNQFVSS